jgi:phage terminase small subunit
MAAKKSKSGEPQKKSINSRQRTFLKPYAKGKTLKEAALQAGYSPKNAAQSGFQALKGVQGRIPKLMDEVGLSDRVLI